MPRASLRAVLPFLAAGLGPLAGALPPRTAEAASPYLVVPEPSVAEATAAYKYANMSAAEALAELDRRKVPYQKADPIPGVLTPVRLTGKLHGVHIHSSIPEGDRATSVYEVLDARLALALDDFAKILSRHDIEEVVHYSLYRPNVPRTNHGVHEVKAAPKAKGAAAEDEEAKGSTAVAGSGAKVAKGSTAVAGPGAKAGKGGSTAADPGAKVAKGGAATASPGPAAPKGASGASGEAKAGAQANKPVAALPALPAGKAFPSPPNKAEHAGARGAKQKAPPAGEKKAAPASAAGAQASTGEAKAAPATKAKATSAAGRSSAGPAGRGARHRTAQKAEHAAAGRARTSTPAKVEMKGAAAKVAPAADKAAPANKAAAKAANKAPAAAKAASPAVAAAPAKGAATAAKVDVASAKVDVASAKVDVASAKGAAPAAKAEGTDSKATSATASRQTWAAPGTRHPAGLAIDVAMLKKRDGQWVSVASHFRGRIGDKTCGDGVRTADTPEARELRSIVCEANDLGVFTYVLTPNYNAAHYDHFHMEIRPQVKWFLYQ